MWMTWRAPASGVVTFNTLGSLFDTVLAVYTGDSLTTLTPVAANDDHNGLLTSRVQFNAVAGQEYHVAVDGFAFAIGEALLKWTLDTTSTLLPVITSLTPNQTVGEGESLTLGVTVGELVTYQWLFNGQPLPGATNSLLKISKVGFDNVGTYNVRLTAGNLTVLSDNISVQMNDTDGQVQRSAAAFDKLVDATESTSLPRSLAGAKSGSVAHGYTVTQTFSTVGATREPDEPKHCGVTGGASAWSIWQSPTNGTAIINTDGSNFDTVLAIYIGPGNSYATLTNVACDNNSGANGQTSRAVFTAKAGTIYYIAVDGVSGAQGTVRLGIAVGTAPQIVAHPQSKTATTGQPTTLTVSANAFPSPIYQWSFNGTNIIGATNALLSLSNVTAASFGSYRVRVTNAIGMVLSLPAELTPARPLRIASRVLQTNGFHLVIECPSGTNYILESSQNLSVWTPLVTNQTSSGFFNFIDPAALTNSCLFYRVRSSP